MLLLFAMQQADVADVRLLIVGFQLRVATYEHIHCTAAWS